LQNLEFRYDDDRYLLLYRVFSCLLNTLAMTSVPGWFQQNGDCLEDGFNTVLIVVEHCVPYDVWIFIIMWALFYKG